MITEFSVFCIHEPCIIFIILNEYSFLAITFVFFSFFLQQKMEVDEEGGRKDGIQRYYTTKIEELQVKFILVSVPRAVIFWYMWKGHGYQKSIAPTFREKVFKGLTYTS